ncbi:MAG: hypothetical protein Q4G71_17625 [Pseudomonadota bacterium]|nr:hypothetical protein [Pseudomonadota bacterium]
MSETPAAPSLPPAPRRRRRGWLAMSLLLNALLAGWLWRALPPAPPPLPAADVGQAVVLRTPGGRLEVAELQQTERFDVARDHTVLGVPVGSTFSQIRVPAHYRYHVELAPEWQVRLLPDGGVRVVAPRVQPSLPVAIDTARMEKETRGLWSLFTGPAQVQALEKSITQTLARKAATAPMLARQREAARATVGEFVAKWLMTQTEWQPHADKPVQVLFADEPIDALQAACGSQPGCAEQWLQAAGL